MIVLLVVNCLCLLGIAWLVHRDAKRHVETKQWEGEPYTFVPESIARRFRDGRPVERATTSRLALTKSFIEREEAESQKVKVI